MSVVATGPVKLTLQTIFAVIPYVNIWAFYRIQKLRKMLLLTLGIGLAFVPVNLLVIGSLDIISLNNPLEIYSNPVFIFYLVIILGIQFSIEIYFMRRWSKKWNSKFDAKKSSN